MKANDVCFVRECFKDGFGVEDIAGVSLLTEADIRHEMREMRGLASFALAFSTRPTTPMEGKTDSM